MELIVGQNSYMTVAEADEIITSRFRSTSKERQLWNNLGDDKAVVIMSATDKYDNDNILYKYKKVDAKQNLQFPRIDDNGNIIECPEEIKKGLLLQALIDIDEEDSEEIQMIKKGVTKYKIKDSEVDYSSNASNINRNSFGFDNDIWNRYFSNFTIIS